VTPVRYCTLLSDRQNIGEFRATSLPLPRVDRVTLNRTMAEPVLPWAKVVS
jgi:hypothetical protein